MKIEIMNGWKDAPHHQWKFLMRPFRYENTPGWVCVTVFGFAVFFLKD